MVLHDSPLLRSMKSMCIAMADGYPDRRYLFVGMLTNWLIDQGYQATTVPCSVVCMNTTAMRLVMRMDGNLPTSVELPLFKMSGAAIVDTPENEAHFAVIVTLDDGERVMCDPTVGWVGRGTGVQNWWLLDEKRHLKDNSIQAMWDSGVATYHRIMDASLVMPDVWRDGFREVSRNWNSLKEEMIVDTGLSYYVKHGEWESQC